MDSFLEGHLDLIYLVYGLAFFVLGIVVFVLPRHDTALSFSRHLGWLAAFGMLHGLLEFTDSLRLHSAAPWLGDLASLLLVSSFAALLEFGRRAWNESGALFRLPAAWVYMLVGPSVAIITLWTSNPLAGLSAGIRYLVGAPGALLSGLALMLAMKTLLRAKDSLAPWVALAALALLTYALLTLFIPVADPRLSLLPSTADFLELTGLPVQLFRALCAMLAALAFVMIIRNASERNVATLIHDAVIRESEAKYRTLFEMSQDAIITRNETGIVDCNQAALRMFGFKDKAELLGRSPFDISLPQQLDGANSAGAADAQVKQAFREGRNLFESMYQRQNGERFLAEVLLTPMPLLGHGVIQAIIRDISERKQSEELIWKQANFDELTGLPNRSMFRDRMNMEIARATRSKFGLALFLIDLDEFKEVNDTLGHDIGDMLLKESSQRIRTSVRELDTVSRLGGDEFTVIISEVPDTAHIEELAQKLIGQLSAPYDLGAETVHVSASVGICMYPRDATDYESLMKGADQAMYAAKSQGRNRYSFFTQSMQEQSQTRMRLNNELRLALERQEFVLHYQPQINLETGRVIGLEALVRWQHPSSGLAPPGLFIPIAESTGLILPLGEWVMATACRQLKLWLEQGLNDICISVNLSARQFRQPELATKVSELLEKTGLKPASLELEMTENLAMDNPRENAKTLSALRDIGVTLAMDDFGTGHSSLGYLKNFPFTRLKLDRSFIMNIETEPNDAIIVSAAINLAHDLGLYVVAEGVEDEKQVDYLSRLKCDAIQGYYFSKPLPAHKVEALIRERNTFAHLSRSAETSSIDVLVIDDDVLLCEFLARVLTHLGHTPCIESDPVSGLEKLRQEPTKYDLFLIDMLMPNMSGIDLIKGIRECCRDTPIIVITAIQSNHVRQALKPIEKKCGLIPGINYFIMEKPLSADAISRIIDKIFVRRANVLLNQ